MHTDRYVPERLAPGQLGYEPPPDAGPPLAGHEYAHEVGEPARESRWDAPAPQAWVSDAAGPTAPAAGGQLPREQVPDGRAPGEQVPDGRAPGEQVHDLAFLLATMTRSVQLLTEAFPLWSLPEPAIGQIVHAAEQLHRITRTFTTLLAAEAEQRGVGSVDGLSRTDWLTGTAEALDPREAPQIATVAAVIAQQRWSALAELLRSGRISVQQAGVIVRFEQDVARVADPAQVRDVTDAMIQGAPVLSVKELTQLASRGRLALKPPKDVANLERQQRMGRAMHRVGTSAGMTEYRLRLDPAGAAVLEAALDPLARPRPDLGWDGVEKHDPRTAATRRADALLELVGRAVAAPEGTPRTPRTKLVVTMDMQVLLGQLRGAGITDSGQVLSAATVRRLACEAAIVPVVLGGPSTVLDMGHTERYFTPAQRRAMSIRDKGCAFPGCTIPPQWCEGHHDVPWSQGGRTDLTNGYLLCGHHHTIVHQRDLHPTITRDAVTWHD